MRALKLLKWNKTTDIKFYICAGVVQYSNLEGRKQTFQHLNNKMTSWLASKTSIFDFNRV